MTTIHANTCRDALARLESMVAMANFNLHDRSVRQQMVSAIGIVVQISRMSDGSRRVTNIAEITGMEGDMVTMHDIFSFVRKGVGPDGKVIGAFRPTGIRPKFLEKLRISGQNLPQVLFEEITEVA
jgi:pilus assembly protein CpaF